MLSDNHWIVPTIAGEYRVNKPPTMGWFIAASMMVFQSKAEWVARLPAMLAGVGTCLLLASMTTRHLGRRVGLLTGLLTATSLFVLTQARLSEADMPLVMFVVLAFWVISRFIHQAEVGKTELAAAAPVVGWSVMFFFAVGMSFLLKGVGPIFVLPAAVVYAGLARDRQAWRIMIHPAGLVLFIVMLVAWPTAAYYTHPQIVDAWNREIIQRVTGSLGETLGKGDPFFLYLYTIPMLLLPWFPLTVIGAVAAVKRQWFRHRFGLLLLCWFGVGFVLLHFNSWKHLHYSMPILPACMPAAGVGLVLLLRYNYAQKKPRHLLTTVAILLTCGIAAAVFRFQKFPGATDIAILIGLLGIGAAVLPWLEHKRWLKLQIAWMFALAWLIVAGVFWRVVPHHDAYRSSAELARRVNEIVPKTMPVTLFGLGEHHIAYYLDRPMRRIDDLTRGSDVAALPRPAYVLAEALAEPLLEKVARVEALDKRHALGKREAEANRVKLYIIR